MKNCNSGWGEFDLSEDLSGQKRRRIEGCILVGRHGAEIKKKNLPLKMKIQISAGP